MEELLGCPKIDVGGFAGVVGACSSVSSGTELTFTAQVERGSLTRGCLGGGGSPTRNSSLGETDRDDGAEVVAETKDGSRALVLSSCSSNASRLGEITRERFSFIRDCWCCPSQALISMTSGDGQENRDDRTDTLKGLSVLIANLKLLHSAKTYFHAHPCKL